MTENTDRNPPVSAWRHCLAPSRQMPGWDWTAGGIGAVVHLSRSMKEVTVMDALTAESARYEALKRELVETHEALDEDTLADTLEGLSDLDEIIAAALRAALEDEALAAALKERIEAQKARLDRIRNRARVKRLACARVMARTGLKTVMAEDLTVSLRPPSQRLDVRDEAAIPQAYWRTPDPVLDRRGLTEALKAGLEVEGAVMVEADPVISVRVK